MLMLRGPVKVDFLFLGRPNPPAPPWTVTRDTLRRIDDHFWDWILWLASKVRAARRELVAEQLALMHEHLLAPMGVASIPATPAEALAAYLDRRGNAERELGVEVPRPLEREVRPVVEAELRGPTREAGRS
jgi:hypothetical protein